MTTLMVCPRNYVLRTLSGKAIQFKAGEPTHVPDDLYADALAVNILPFKGEGIDTDPSAPGSARVLVTGPLRDALIYAAIREIAERNFSEDFDGGGMPKSDPIRVLSGVQLGKAELSKYWSNYREILGSNSEFPTHPNTEIVQELNGLQTRKQLEGFAKDYDLPYETLKGLSNTELKAALLTMVINNRQAPGGGGAGHVEPTKAQTKPKNKGNSPHSGGLVED